MTQKQLANVLTKILGLYLAVQSLPGFIQQTTNFIRAQTARSQSVTGGFGFTLVYSVTMLAVGIWLIVYSRQITGWLFNNDEP